MQDPLYRARQSECLFVEADATLRPQYQNLFGVLNETQSQIRAHHREQVGRHVLEGRVC